MGVKSLAMRKFCTNTSYESIPLTVVITPGTLIAYRNSSSGVATPRLIGLPPPPIDFIPIGAMP